MWHKLKVCGVLLFALLIGATGYAEIVDTYPFQSAETRVRAVNLAKSLRCPQCQNQNLVESNSPIAYDLRLEVYKLADAGVSDQQIVEQMTARFGDFVRYDPPFKTTTWLLWGAPFALLLLAGVLLWRKAKGQVRSELKRQAEGQSAVGAVCSAEKVNPSRFNFLSIFAVTALIGASAVFVYSLSGRCSAWQQGATLKAQVVQSGGEQRQQYRQELQNALRADYNNGENWFQLGLNYLQAEEYANALESFTRAEYLLGANSELLAAAATALYYQADKKLTDKAKKWLELSLQQDPNQLRALSLLAADAFGRGDYTQARVYWQQILDSNHHDLDRRSLIQNLQAAEMLGGMQH
ncbi:heme lyase NrfEFG subunit NrfF [Testudinibacter sp. P80/BLE/0925]|uniref:heme lyase NrfEFG subunit NrfF n=1 Tax=Testudinibacter sp. TW-1 TaxID=3417757 RepID=UPI003D36A00D